MKKPGAGHTHMNHGCCLVTPSFTLVRSSDKGDITKKTGQAALILLYKVLSARKLKEKKTSAKEI